MKHGDRCSEKNLISKLIEFDKDCRSLMETEGFWAPYTHQVLFCMECSRVVAQEDNTDRKARCLAILKDKRLK